MNHESIIRDMEKCTARLRVSGGQNAGQLTAPLPVNFISFVNPVFLFGANESSLEARGTSQAVLKLDL